MVYLFCGQKGTGKSLTSVSLIKKLYKKGYYDFVYCNKPLNFAKKIDSIGWVNYRFPKNSAIIIDEAQLYFNSREFSKLTKSGIGMELLDYLTMCRHYNLDIYFITQSHKRIDLQIRELSDYVYYLKNTIKIPFLKIPILTYGYKFSDILEFEKYVNPNNFQKEYNSRLLLKFITYNDLKQYDTHHIEDNYILKPMIDNKDWS